MFIDLSGFTPLTETLMKQGNEGAEQLSISLNSIFGPMVELVYGQHGFIPYFAGDAFTAIFPAQADSFEARHLLFTAQLLRDMYTKEGIRKTRFGDFQIGIKIGLSFGEVEWGIVGDRHHSFYFRGSGIDGCAESEHHASEQEIVIDERLYQQLKPFPIEVEDVPQSQGFYRLLGDMPGDFHLAAPAALPELKKEVLSKFMPNTVLAFNEEGEFRDVIAVFISFKGIDDHKVFNEFVSIVLQQFNNFSGYFKEVDFGDKGGVMVGFFGAPVSFENNDERALQFVASISQELKPLQSRSDLVFRVGITRGEAYTGIVGGEKRCQYAAVGNRINLAARLMIKADWGSVLVDSDMQKCSSFKFEHKGDIRYKGIEGDIPTYQLSGRNVTERVVFSGQIIGRERELKQLQQFARPIFEGQLAGMVFVYGEAGIGKSRLSYELRQQLKNGNGLNWCTCQADQILQKPFNPFIYFLRNYFRQSPENVPQTNRQHFEERFNQLLESTADSTHPSLQTLRKEVKRTQSVLAALINIQYPDSLWEQLDAPGRYRNTLQALTSFFKLGALINPMVIELEDGHWYDQNSKEFLLEFVRQIDNFPIYLLVTSRYTDDGDKPLLLPKEHLERYSIPQMEIDLNIFQPDALRDFAEDKLGGSISKDFEDHLVQTTSGNPFYLEQIIEYLAESNLLEQFNGQWHIKKSDIIVSNSINAILMARIDRLTSLVKETVKAAAVIGREFEVSVLGEVLKEHEEFIRRNGNKQLILKEQIQTAEQGQIWRAMTELRYMFKHSLLQEAVYRMQLSTRLRKLHQLIAEAIENLYGNSLEERYVDLAFHYGKAEIGQKTNYYLEKAADFAMRNFQNLQSIDLYDRLLANWRKDNNKEALAKTLLNKAKVLKLIGRWEECQQLLTEALAIAHQLSDQILLGRTNNKLGDLLLLKGEYELADKYLEKAARYFEVSNDALGRSKVYGNLGNLYFRQGHYLQAKEFFIRSIDTSRKLEHRSANAQIVSNLGLTYMNQGNYDEGIQCQLAELEHCEAANDKPGEAILHVNVGIVYYEKGDYDAALEHYTKGLELSEELGNKQLTSIAIGCMGSVYQRKGDYNQAMQHFIKDLKLVEELGDKQGTAIALGLIGELRSAEGEFDLAVQYLERAKELSEELGYQKGIAKAVNTLGDIFMNTSQYDQALQCYDQAIEISRSINNRLVLGYSLVEKGYTLIEKSDLEWANEIQREVLDLAENLDNPDLLFEALLLSAKVNHLAGNKELALKNLDAMLQRARSDRERAAIYYERWNMGEKAAQSKQRALKLFQQLYDSEPRFIYKKKIDQLTQTEK